MMLISKPLSPSGSDSQNKIPNKFLTKIISFDQFYDLYYNVSSRSHDNTLIQFNKIKQFNLKDKAKMSNKTYIILIGLLTLISITQGIFEFNHG